MTIFFTDLEAATRVADCVVHMAVAVAMDMLMSLSLGRERI
jgi:hypothetical protein